jgi:photosystem II stability/assembly factor-like uncharacterized protein
LATAPASAVTEPAGLATAARVPTGFRATSITWLDPHEGWVLGAAPCGQSMCSGVLHTTDGGNHWRHIGGLNARIAQIGEAKQPGVTEIRFADDSLGWAFAPELVRTRDGGHTWSRAAIPGNGKQVFDLAADPQVIVAVVSPCAWANFCDRPLSLWRARPQHPGRWHRVDVTLPPGVRADVSVYGATVYVVDPQQDMLSGGRDRFYVSTDGGRHFARRAAPCEQQPGVPMVQTAPTSGTDVAVLCVGNPHMSDSLKYVYRSHDAGRTFHYAGTMPVHGYQSQLAASPRGHLAVASTSDGSFIYINLHGDTHWRMVWASSDGGAGWNDITYVTDRTGWVVRGPLSWFGGRGKLYVTHDAGHSWYIVHW